MFPYAKCVSKVAQLIKELTVVDGSFLFKYLKNVKKLIDELEFPRDEARGIEIRFWNILLECEVLLLGFFSYSIGDYIQEISEKFWNLNEAHDIIFLFALKKLYDKLKVEEPELFEKCMDYVRKLRIDLLNVSVGDLTYRVENLDRDSKMMIDYCKDTRPNIEAFSVEINLTYNRLDLAKYFLKNALENPKHSDTYFDFLHEFFINDNTIGSGWFVFYINKLCMGNFTYNRFMHRYNFSEVNKVKESQFLRLIGKLYCSGIIKGELLEAMRKEGLDFEKIKLNS